MADGEGTEAAAKSKVIGSSRVFPHDFDEDLGDEDLFSFFDFPEEVEGAIAEVYIGRKKNNFILIDMMKGRKK